MKLTSQDIEMLMHWGFTKQDIPQIEEAMQKSKTTYKQNSKTISREEAIRILGQKRYLAISRSAFHFTAAQKTEDGQIVYFNSRNLFKQYDEELSR